MHCMSQLLIVVCIWTLMQGSLIKQQMRGKLMGKWREKPEQDKQTAEVYRPWEGEQSSSSSYQKLLCNLLCPTVFFSRQALNLWFQPQHQYKRKCSSGLRRKNYQGEAVHSSKHYLLFANCLLLKDSEHKRGAFAFRLAGRRELLEHLEVGRRLDGVWHKQSVFVLKVSNTHNILAPRRRKMFLYR